MTDGSNDLLLNLDKLHTTPMGVTRIKRNLRLECEDVVQYCKDLVKSGQVLFERQGKNWYVRANHCILTVNAYSYTIITAHLNGKDAQKAEL